MDEFWRRFVLYTPVAGAIWTGTVCVIIWTMVWGLVAGPNGLPLPFGVAGVATLIALFAGGLVAIVVGALTRATLHPAGARYNRDHIGAFAGALVAVVATLPISFYVVWGPDRAQVSVRVVACVIAYIAGSILICQGAGMLAGIGDLRRNKRRRIASRPLRVSLRTLLVVMVLMSGVLATLKATGVLSGYLGIFLVTATVFTLISRPPIAWLINRWLDQKLIDRRIQRST